MHNKFIGRGRRDRGDGQIHYTTPQKRSNSRTPLAAGIPRVAMSIDEVETC